MLTDKGPCKVIADSMCNELERYRQQCPTRDRQYDVVTPCYEMKLRWNEKWKQTILRLVMTD